MSEAVTGAKRKAPSKEPAAVGEDGASPAGSTATDAAKVSGKGGDNPATEDEPTAKRKAPLQHRAAVSEHANAGGEDANAGGASGRSSFCDPFVPEGVAFLHSMGLSVDSLRRKAATDRPVKKTAASNDKSTKAAKAQAADAGTHEQLESEMRKKITEAKEISLPQLRSLISMLQRDSPSALKAMMESLELSPLSQPHFENGTGVPWGLEGPALFGLPTILDYAGKRHLPSLSTLKAWDYATAIKRQAAADRQAAAELEALTKDNKEISEKKMIELRDKLKNSDPRPLMRVLGLTPQSKPYYMGTWEGEPTPGDLSDYDDVFQGGAQTILEYAQREQLSSLDFLKTWSESD